MGAPIKTYKVLVESILFVPGDPGLDALLDILNDAHVQHLEPVPKKATGPTVGPEATDENHRKMPPGLTPERESEGKS